MRDAFVKTLFNIAKNDKDVIILTGDLGFGVLKPFFEELPDRIINAGIAEQNMTSVAAGLALSGKKVFTYSIGNFPTLRCLEQIRNDCAYHDADVKIVCIGGGFTYGGLGMSHFATEDISVMRAIPNVKVFAPGDVAEAEKVTETVCKIKGTCYIRLGRGGGERVYPEHSLDDKDILKAVKLADGKDVAILCTGGILQEVYRAVNALKQEGIFVSAYSFPTVKPVDKDTILSLAKTHKALITVEENNLCGGFGSLILETLSDAGERAKLIRMGIPDVYPDVVGSQSFLRERYAINAAAIENKVKELI